ncbi:hypothetical protein AN639_01145 [Candidatus Epulonipiscium fishelsonii]|uniref:Uncharacterized protein n=1 Tax=Candidatus Epulonipiscium fishelsonii TaxID=77094 RepID=A0ACC8X7S4_9FIRM|nr:hypothetical protein AN396_12100 [Epulopiscium sp. SCG-B11WGA-EpuloA1]ONI40714.1 hypothetical protein AN639_01145 [Epulopiscium sp. SCG-B05WGA-EpuloA1]ONI47764.1 hypothetical protein AN644_04005 [Epulopiscium sp. SCG-C06WGA-EpuloA1]
MNEFLINDKENQPISSEPQYKDIEYPSIDGLEHMKEISAKKEIKLDRLPPLEDTVEIMLSLGALAWRNREFGFNLRKWKKVDIILLGIIGWWIIAYFADYKYEILPEEEL